jgi:hypothetical protein
MGNNLQSVKLVNPNIVSQMTTLLTQCLSQLVAANLITITNITVAQNTQNASAVSVIFSYYNVSYSNSQTLSFTLTNGSVNTGV